MKNRSRMRKAILICGASMLIAIYSGGCNSNAKNQATSDFFASYDELRDSQRFTRVQAASGARADATLQPYHFDKGELNSLGREKLALMLDDDADNNPITIWLNGTFADDQYKAARQDSVIAYLKEQGLEDSQISFQIGPNPDSKSLASDGLARLVKTETGAGGASSGSDASNTGNAATGEAK